MKLFVFALCALSAFVACTAAPPEGRIVGGDDAELGQVPYQASLDIAGLYTCGAVILNERYALTAMSCVCSIGSEKPWPPQMFAVTVGSVKLYNSGTRVVLEEIIINPNYSEFNTGLAILKLRTPLVFSETVQPIELSSVNPPVGAHVEVSGWGRIKETEENMYPTLQINDGFVVDDAQCRRVLGKSDSQIICLGHARKNGLCRGDFGGPAVYNGKLVGIAAYIVGECGAEVPDVLTSVAENYDWIVEQMTP